MIYFEYLASHFFTLYYPLVMEPHAVPQNVTTFEFHLIGDMTLKQFAYLASGLGIAYFTFLAIYPLSPILALPIIIVSALLGFAFAFLPILDRPLDHWLKAYLKAIFSPTQGSWVFSKGQGSNASPLFKNRLNLYLASLGTSEPAFKPSPAPTPIKSAPALGGSGGSFPPPEVPKIPSNQPVPSTEELNKLVLLAKQAQLFQNKIVDLEKQIEQLKLNRPPAATLTAPTPAVTPTPVKPEPIKTTAPPAKKAEVKVVEAPKQKNTQILLTSQPNVISGVITDNTGSYLESVIVIIHNKDNLPVRALKTNKLGQFAGATPLSDGVYTITLEKEGFSFDNLQTTLDGKVLAPIEIIAKR